MPAEPPSPADAPAPTPALPRRTLRGRIFRGLRRCVRVLLYFLVLFVLVILVGLIPVNNGFQPTEDGVEITVTSTEIHADFVLPMRNETVDWSKHLLPGDFTGDVSGATRVAFGWGNKEFYMDTRTWANLKAGAVFRAMFWPSPTCMHVFLWDDNIAFPNSRKTKISHEQYRRLVEYIQGTFRRDESGRFMCVKGRGYATNDAFYEAHGSYHVLNTCNCWVGQGLKVAGVQTGWFTPLPKTVSLYMPAAR